MNTKLLKKIRKHLNYHPRQTRAYETVEISKAIPAAKLVDGKVVKTGGMVSVRKERKQLTDNDPRKAYKAMKKEYK